MNKFLITVIFFSSFINISFSQFDPGIGDAEIAFVNQTEFATNGNGYPVLVKIFPVGAIFNGQKKYSLSSIAPIVNFPETPFDKKIMGYQSILNKRLFISQTDWYVRANFDDDEFNILNSSKFSVGYGLYKIEFYELHEGGNSDNISDYNVSAGYCYMDWRDANYKTSGFPGYSDIEIHYYDRNDVRFHWRSIIYYYPVDTVDYHIKIWEQFGSGYPSSTQVKGPFFSDNSSNPYLNYPIDSRDSGAVNHINPNEFYLDLQILNQGTNLKSNESLNFINSSLTIDDNINFTINNNAFISFTGIGSGLISKDNSILNFPQNFILGISNGGNINSQESIFTSSSPWNGIKLENSGSYTILNCTFNNALTAISISNDYLGNSASKFIKNNIFNISQNNGRGIDLRNQNLILIDGNTFNISNSNTTVGIFFRNSDSPSENEQSFNYDLNIVNNKFHDGYLPIFISNLTSNRTPFYIYNNSFTGNNVYSIGGLKVTGDIKNNQFDANNINRSIGLWNSNPNIYGNNLSSVSTNMYLNYSFPSASPTVNSNNQLIWTGGRNYFNSLTKENIFLDASYPYLDRGRNDFTIDQTYQSNHLFGNMPDSVNLYEMTYNCWHGNNNQPSYSLFKYVNDTFQIPVNYSPTYCIETFNPLSNIVTDMGAGIFDTVFVSNNNSSESPPEDEILLEQARTANKNKNFPDAITNYKGLVDNFTGSSFIYTSLYEIYDNYTSLDTSGEASETDILFGDLKQYLNNKINSDIYDKDFNSLAFDIILMCETRMKNYEVALTGYEFIALYHPNAEQRMLASWDFEAIDALTGGSGGGEKQLQITNYELQIEEHDLRELKRLDKLIDDTPLLKSMKKNYEKINSNKKYNKIDKVENEKIILRAKENIFRAKFMQKGEKEKRFIEDMNLLLDKGSSELKTTNTEVSNLQDYKLNQNYPNPFNPTTKISFYIPFSNNVILKVFDITGKQVRVLLNEYRQKGNHDIEFNGKDLASGVYYYKLESGSFIEIKKMVLIK